MQSTELRIGNLVYGINRRSEVHLPATVPLKVLQIELFNCEVLPHEENPAHEEKFFKISNADLSPIPLSEEWLSNFGIKKNSLKIQDIYIDFLYDPTTQNYLAVSNSIIIARFKYVHQLQNLYFALTADELIYNKNIHAD